MSEFPQRLKQLRVERGLTLKELAGILDTTESTLSRYENGNNSPGVPMLLEMAELFGCSVDYLLGESNDRRTAEEVLKKYYQDGVSLEEVFDKFEAEYKGEKLTREQIVDLFKILDIIYSK